MKDFKKAYISHRAWLRNFCEAHMNVLTHDCYETLWNEIRSMDHELGED